MILEVSYCCGILFTFVSVVELLYQEHWNKHYWYNIVLALVAAAIWPVVQLVIGIMILINVSGRK